MRLEACSRAWTELTLDGHRLVPNCANNKLQVQSSITSQIPSFNGFLLTNNPNELAQLKRDTKELKNAVVVLNTRMVLTKLNAGKAGCESIASDG